MPNNPFTNVATTLDFSAALGTAPVTDVAGGVSLNLVALGGGVIDAYDITGEDDTGAILSLVLTNQ